ncbi:hypothetical protein HGRIS_012933 [Hohenbuehelia grisea]|uniref:cAMP-independent regulatory protein pac2 n=1 Tax=Hohenbuehelia grisea TaxID=104357 RepID=A0ABR3ITT6_9AGAR
MQQATHPRLHVRDMRDAHTVLEAVRRGLLRPVTRRLNEMERSMQIRSGAIFVWEESDDEVGLKRWTDGRVWSQSRMREPYLFYDEKLPSDPDHDNGNRSPTYRFVDGVSRGAPVSSAMSHHDRSARLPSGLIKQAYSAWVLVAPNSRPRKWHLTAYFTYADLPNLPTIEKDPVLRGVPVPNGIYRSGKARSRSGDEEGASDVGTPPATPAGPSRANSYGVDRTLPSLHSAVGHHNGHPPHSRNHGMRPPEDQRLIEMLNSRLIL